MPTGDLRDQKKSYKRAQIIVVTKCKPSLSQEERLSIIEEIDPLPHQKVFFTCIAYGAPYHVTKREFGFIDENTEVLLVTGIANPRPLKNFLEERIHGYQMMQYNDHHIFLIDDWKDIKKRFLAIESDKKIILTTEKDATRLLKFGSEVYGMPFYVLPIEHRFLFGQETEFTDEVSNFILNFTLPS